MTIDEGERLHRNAASYRVVALDLYAELDRNSDLVQLRLDDQLQEPTLRIAGYTYATVMLRALATELALKALAYRRKGKYLTGRNGHDLLALFDDLDEPTRNLIAALAEDQGMDSPRCIVEQHRSEFVDWRYPHESERLSTEFIQSQQVLELLLNVYNHAGFRSLPPPPNTAKIG